MARLQLHPWISIEDTDELVDPHVLDRKTARAYEMSFCVSVCDDTESEDEKPEDGMDLDALGPHVLDVYLAKIAIKTNMVRLQYVALCS